MAGPKLQAALAASILLAQTAMADGSCASVLTPDYERPVVGAGYTAQLILKGLNKPRGMRFDQNGALLVVQQGKGIQHITFNDNGATCLSVKDSKSLIDFDDLNHAVELSGDGKTLYASSAESVFSWDYDASAGTLSSDKKTLVSKMSNDDHVSRTLLMSKKSPGTLLVSRGSGSNMDMSTQQISSGRSQIRAFDVNSPPDGDGGYDYASTGTVLGWGLRNSVGVAEHPVTGGIFSVENSADEIQRKGQDVHQDNPGEEMNFHGFLNGSTDSQGGNYGYPDCFALWDAGVPDVGAMTVGSQFALDPDDNVNDETCAKNYVAPRLTFQAHTAPLDMMFSPDGTEAYVTFHGSWDRDDPAGYKLSVIPFSASGGQPTDKADSKSAARDVLSNPDLDKCPGSCFRPVGLAMDKSGRIFMSSDATGEIYVLQKAEMSALGDGGGSPTTSGGGTLVTSTDAPNPNIGARSGRNRLGTESTCLGLVALALSLVGSAMVFTA